MVSEAVAESVILYVNANAMWCIPITGILVSKPWAEPEFALASFPSVFTRKYYDDSLHWLIWEKKSGCGINKCILYY